MKKIKFFVLQIIILVWFIPRSQVWARDLPRNQDEFCQRFEDLDLIGSFLDDEANLLSFENQGGILNGGVCWWHARFQRNLVYLSVYRPDLPMLKKSEVSALIQEIRYGKKIVIIPGVSNAQEFSSKYKKEIIKVLEAWQVYDGVVLMKWIQGLSGNTETTPSELNKMMDRLYQYVENEKKIAYTKLQIKGITAHAWLINGMKKVNGGHDISYLDSNMPKSTLIYHYQTGDKSFYKKEYGKFLPYLEFIREEERLTAIAKTYCFPSYHLPENYLALWEKGEQEDLVSVIND